MPDALSSAVARPTTMARRAASRVFSIIGAALALGALGILNAGPALAEKPGDTPANTPADKSADKPADTLADKQPDKPAQKKTERKIEPAYPLDDLPRKVAPRGVMKCPKVDLITYKGEAIKISPAAMVYDGFRERLTKFERVVEDVGIEVYGRAPQRIVNLGTYVCRRMAAYPDWLSEHGLGNAIDVEGFDFGPLPKGAALPNGLHKSLKNGFQIRLQRHWRAKIGIESVHARFLKTLARRLIGRRDIFRVLLGPGYPGHTSHFHFDMASFRMVQIFDEGELLTAEPAPKS